MSSNSPILLVHRPATSCLASCSQRPFLAQMATFSYPVSFSVFSQIEYPLSVKTCTSASTLHDRGTEGGQYARGCKSHQSVVSPAAQAMQLYIELASLVISYPLAAKFGKNSSKYNSILYQRYPCCRAQISQACSISEIFNATKSSLMRRGGVVGSAPVIALRAWNQKPPLPSSM